MTSIGLRPGHFDASGLAPVELPFTEEEYCTRLKKLTAMAADEGIDLLWVTSPEGVAWLHGFTASWYKGQAPMRYPQCYGTAVHVASRRFIHFDNPTEEPVLATTSRSRDNRWLPDREAGPNIAFIVEELTKEGWLSGTVGMEFWSYLPNRAISTMFEGAFLAAGARPDAAGSVPHGPQQPFHAVQVPRRVHARRRLRDQGHADPHSVLESPELLEALADLQLGAFESHPAPERLRPVRVDSDVPEVPPGEPRPPAAGSVADVGNHGP